MIAPFHLKVENCLMAKNRNKAKARVTQRTQAESQAQAQTTAADSQKPQLITKEDGPSAAIAGEKAQIVINEVIGVAHQRKEHLEAATFAQRFNQHAQNLYPLLHLLGVVRSEGQETARHVEVLYKEQVVAEWAPGTDPTGISAEQRGPSPAGNVLVEGHSTLLEQRRELGENDPNLQQGDQPSPVAAPTVEELEAQRQPVLDAGLTDADAAAKKGVVGDDTAERLPPTAAEDPQKVAEQQQSNAAADQGAEDTRTAEQKAADEEAARKADPARVEGNDLTSENDTKNAGTQHPKEEVAVPQENDKAKTPNPSQEAQ